MLSTPQPTVDGLRSASTEVPGRSLAAALTEYSGRVPHINLVVTAKVCVGHDISLQYCRQSDPFAAVAPHLGLAGDVEILGRENVLSLLNKPAGLYPRVSKRVPVGEIPTAL